MALSGSGLEGRLGALGGERRLELLLDAVTDYAIYLLDVNGHVASWNAGAQRFKGYTADEIIGQHFSRFYTEDDRAAGLPARALRIAANEGRFEAEGWRLRKDGKRFWTSVVIDPVYDSDGSLIGFAKVTRDITAKRQAEEALYTSEQRFRILVQGVRDCAIYMLSPEGQVTNWNAGAQAIKGYTADEIIGRHFSQFYTADDQVTGAPQRALETALRDGKYEAEGWRVRKSGEPFWAGVLIDPVYDDHGAFVGFAKVTRDLTERRKAQDAIDAAREAMAQSQKLEAIGRLTGGVAHDFNNLLTVIRSSADLLARPDLSPEKRQRYIAAIAETADRAASLTGQLLAFARRQPLQPEVFDAAERMGRLSQIILASLGPLVSLTIEADEGVGAVRADPNQFETALLNMAINARDAMPDGGTLHIHARRALEKPAVRGHAAARGDFVAIEVRDSGFGIGPGTLDRIFEPFFTTKEVNKGTGLGLSQVYGFAKQSGGEIAVESQEGYGTSFTLYLPRADADADAVRSPGRPHGPPKLLPVGGRILLVEDNETVGRFAEGLLREMGQEVTWVTHAEAALTELTERRDAFDLVFSDVVMPGKSGIVLGLEIAARWPDLPVVLTSGYSHVLAEEGSHGFPVLQKPYSVEGLTRALSTVRAR